MSSLYLGHINQSEESNGRFGIVDDVRDILSCECMANFLFQNLYFHGLRGFSKCKFCVDVLIGFVSLLDYSVEEAPR